MEEWAGFGRRVEAHLAVIDNEMAALRDTLRGAGINVKRQRIRITRDNAQAAAALALLRHGYPRAATPSQIGQALGLSAEYAYDLLASLVASGNAERISRGHYRSTATVSSGNAGSDMAGGAGGGADGAVAAGRGLSLLAHPDGGDVSGTRGVGSGPS